MDIIEAIKLIEEKVNEHKCNKNWCKVIKFISENIENTFSIDDVVSESNMKFSEVLHLMEYFESRGYVKDIRCANSGRFEIIYVVENHIVKMLAEEIK